MRSVKKCSTNASTLTADSCNPTVFIRHSLVERNIETKVLRGENEGRTLKHDNVVREFQTIQTDAKGEGNILLNMPNDFKQKDCSVMAYLQNSETWKIIGAAKIAVIN